MAIGLIQIPSRLDAIPFYFQRITRNQHVFFPNPPRDINGFRNNNQVYWQLPPDRLVFNAGNNYQYDFNIFNTDSTGSIVLQTPFIITAEGTLRFSGSSVKVVIIHRWTHRFMDADGNILRDLTPNNNPIEISNATPAVLTVHDQDGVEYPLGRLSREIEVYPYQLPALLTAKLQDINLSLNDIRVGIKMDLTIKTFPVSANLRPTQRFGRVTDYTDPNLTPQEDEVLMSVLYSNPVISFRQGEQASQERLGIIRPDPENLFPPDGVTQEQFNASTMGQLLIAAVRAPAGGRSALLVNEKMFNLPEQNDTVTFTMPANLGRQAQTFYPEGSATGFAHAEADKGVVLDERGTYSIELQTSLQFDSALITDNQASVQIGVVLFHMRVNAAMEEIIVNTWIDSYLLDRVRGSELAPLLSIPMLVGEVNDFFNFIVSYKSLTVNDNIKWRSQNLPIPGTQIAEVDRRFVITRIQL